MGEISEKFYEVEKSVSQFILNSLFFSFSEMTFSFSPLLMCLYRLPLDATVYSNVIIFASIFCSCT